MFPLYQGLRQKSRSRSCPMGRTTGPLRAALQPASAWGQPERGRSPRPDGAHGQVSCPAACLVHSTSYEAQGECPRELMVPWAGRDRGHHSASFVDQWPVPPQGRAQTPGGSGRDPVPRTRVAYRTGWRRWGNAEAGPGRFRGGRPSGRKDANSAQLSYVGWEAPRLSALSLEGQS